MVIVSCYVVGRFWGLYTDSFLPNLLLICLLQLQRNQGRKEKKARVLFDSKILFWVLQQFCGVECFLETLKTVSSPSQSVWSILWHHLRQLQVWGSIVCSVGTFSRCCFKLEINNAILLSRHVRFLLVAERKRSIQSRRLEIPKLMSFSLAPGSLSF